MGVKKEIGLAIVGCGTIGRIRAMIARDYPGVGWIGLCDVNQALGKSSRPIAMRTSSPPTLRSC
jgi:myo-inositol 2-dehydrogenase / D-chiro-inositol 1-dehydrogenase